LKFMAPRRHHSLVRFVSLLGIVEVPLLVSKLIQGWMK
jgi:hypothetical protein